MIKLDKIDKYYNKSKSNELHVLNNISLELPNVGLVTILGRSGSGKSTLLNIIGGLDSANGKLSYDDLSSYNYEMNKIDKYRQKHISYIFQNYLLIDQISVYDNLKVTLEFIGIYDKEEQQKRIEYVLKSVGMFKFRKKHADKLSGGQMQRVAIARALLKNNKIIIADEPTGNLDSENTIEVMNILKRISEKTLVLLVTHNKEIAEFYSDRIIEMADGKIVRDYLNAGEKSLSLQSDNQIHLLDYQKQLVEADNLCLNLYTNSYDAICLNIIVKNDTLYIDTKHKVKIVDGVDIQVKDDHFEEIKQHTVAEYDYDTSWYKNEKGRNYKFFHYLKNAFFAFFKSSRKEKLFHCIFVLIGVIIAFCTISFVNYTQVDDSSFSTEKVVLATDEYDDYYPNVSLTTLKKAINDQIVTEIYYYFEDYANYDFYLNSHRDKRVSFNGYYYPRSLGGEILAGDSPESSEVLIGSELADLLIQEIGENLAYDDLVNFTIQSGYYRGLLTVSGVVEGANSVYFADDFYYGSLIYFNDYNNKYENLYLLSDESKQIKEGEMIASAKYQVGDMVNGFKVVEVLASLPENYAYVNNISRLNFYASLFEDIYNQTISFKVDDLEKANAYFAERGYVLTTPYELAYQYNAKMLYESRLTSIIFIISLFGFSVIYIYFSTRSKMINQIKTIGVYRSIGATKMQITQVYLARTIVNTSLTAVLGYAVTCGIYSYIAINLARLGGDILFNTKFAPLYLFFGFVIMYLLHLFFGLLPVWLLMKKSPAEINSKYDI